MNQLWEGRFLDLARLVASWSKDPSTKVGAVIVRPDRTVCSVGYNGFPRKMPDDPEWWARKGVAREREDKLSRTIHAEVNALLHAREPVHGYTVVTWPFLSCDRCFVQLAQAGIARFVAPACPEALRERWEPSFEKVRKYAEEMGVNVTEVR